MVIEYIRTHWDECIRKKGKSKDALDLPYTYTSPCDFPAELKERIKANPGWWDTEDNTYIDMNNWFEYIYDHTIDGKTYSDGIMFEDDLSEYSVEDIKNAMIKVGQYIMED